MESELHPLPLTAIIGVRYRYALCPGNFFGRLHSARRFVPPTVRRPVSSSLGLAQQLPQLVPHGDRPAERSPDPS